MQILPLLASTVRLTYPYAKVRSGARYAMPSAVLTSKGQITIPAAVRKALQVDAGDRLQFVAVEAGRYEIVAATQPVTTLKGMFGKPAKPISVRQMNKAIASAAARRQ